MPIRLDFDKDEVVNLLAKAKGKDDFIYLVFLGDLHIGHKDFSPSFLQKAVTLIKRLSEQHTVEVVLMGDLIETDKDYASPYMIEDVAERTQEQLKTMLQVLSPIAHLCKIALWGNHEERLIRDTKTKRALEMVGIKNFFEMILKQLNPKIYVAQPQRGVLFNLGARCSSSHQDYEIRVSHGSYGGYKRPELQCERESENYPTVSLIAMGHHHQKFFKEVVRMGLEKNRRAIYMQYWLGTGTFLRYPAYAEHKSYPVNVMGFPIIKVHAGCQHLEYMNGPDFQPRFLKAAGMMPFGPRPKLDFVVPVQTTIPNPVCPKCDTVMQKMGFLPTKSGGRKQRFRCVDCGQTKS
jgi:hypothetical protein